MKQLIDKSALVAEIEKLLHEDWHSNEYISGKKYALIKILSFLDTLEVKEVDLVGQLNGFQNFYAHENGGEFPSAIEIAKHFFELGLKAKEDKL